jgi:hypothetical protein
VGVQAAHAVDHIRNRAITVGPNIGGRHDRHGGWGITDLLGNFRCPDHFPLHQLLQRKIRQIFT